MYLDEINKFVSKISCFNKINKFFCFKKFEFKQREDRKKDTRLREKENREIKHLQRKDLINILIKSRNLELQLIKIFI